MASSRPGCSAIDLGIRVLGLYGASESLAQTSCTINRYPLAFQRRGGGLSHVEQISSRTLVRRGRAWKKFPIAADRAAANFAVARVQRQLLASIFLISALAPFFVWAYRAVLGDGAWLNTGALNLPAGLCVAALSLTGLLLVRMGYLRVAAYALLIAVACGMLYAHVATGLVEQSKAHLLHVVWMLVAALLVGRWALWTMYACSIVSIALGFAVDIHHGSTLTSALEIAGGGVAILIAIALLTTLAVIIDRCCVLLFASAQSLEQHNAQLQLANARLQQAIIDREAAQSQLVQAQKVETVGRMASGIVHDFNHFLSLILGFARRGQRESEPAAQRDALHGVESAAKRAAAMTRKLLDFSRSDAPQAERFDVAQAVAELKPLLRQLFDPRVNVVLDIDEGAHWIQFDRVHFELVVLNIAANANDAMPEGGCFQLRVRSDAVKRRVTLDFKDNGMGMSPEVQARIFDAFYTTKSRDDGTGLGLAIGRDLVLAAGGSLDVASEPGKGSRFTISLPGFMSLG
jgi:signal transduction histidine kinase